MTNQAKAPEPGTPLPWGTIVLGRERHIIKQHYGGTFDKIMLLNSDFDNFAIAEKRINEKNAAYIVHACNNFPTLSAQLAELAKPCVWTWDDEHEKWDTACGEAFQVITDTPAENGIKFCPFCQHTISEESPNAE